jgi:hypothetical protein
MSFVTKLTNVLTGGLVDSVANVADRFIQTPEEKEQFKLAMEQVISDRQANVEATAQAELQAKERIIVAEMNQGDNYTKRARPTVVYGGLLIIAFNYCLVPLIQTLFAIEVAPFALPDDFWMAWGSCVGIWSIGRSFEKYGVNNSGTRMVTGSKPTSIFE